MVETFYRTGSLVFGGGHVVLPLLHAGVVDPGWVAEDRFLAGYGAAQAVPGPLFSFAAYLGAVAVSPLGGWTGAAIALGAIYLPSFLLIYGVLPYWDRLRESAAFRRALVGTNAAVVGLLAAALYRPIWTGAIESAADVAVAVIGLGLLVVGRVPPVVVVALAAIAGQLMRG
jgi:chromate transporter